MSRFFADIQGSRGQATKQGTISSGIVGHIRGWNIGVRVSCFVDKDGNDRIRIYKTGGSNGGYVETLLAEFGENDKDDITRAKIVKKLGQQLIDMETE